MAASDRYRPVSMIVDLAEDCARPHIFALTGPKDWQPRLARKIFHETVHYWQHISQGFLVRLVEEDWLRLKAFSETGAASPAGPVKRRYVAVDPAAGFSVQDLVECHARFWDVQAVGPPNLIEMELDDPTRVTDPVLTRDRYDALKADGKIWREFDETGKGRYYSSLSFDLAMELAAGRYARPYLALRGRTNDLLAGALFPLVAHAALQTDAPVAFYGALIDRLLPRTHLPPDGHIEDHWRALYPDVMREALTLAVETFGREFTVAITTIEACRLDDHPGYKLALTLLSLAGRYLADHRPRALFYTTTGMPVSMSAEFGLDFILGCVGMADSREPDLLTFLAPPLVRFAGARHWLPGAVLDRVGSALPSPPDLGPIPELRRTFAEGLDAIDRDWSRLAAAAILAAAPA